MCFHKGRSILKFCLFIYLLSTTISKSLTPLLPPMANCMIQVHDTHQNLMLTVKCCLCISIDICRNKLYTHVQALQLWFCLNSMSDTRILIFYSSPLYSELTEASWCSENVKKWKKGNWDNAKYLMFCCIFFFFFRDKSR